MDPSRTVRTLFVVGAVYHLAWLLVSTIPLNPGADSDRYLNNAYRPAGLFSDLAAPAGYPIYLKIVGALPERPLAILLSQHAMAMLSAFLLWLLARRIADRLEVSRWWAVPAPAFAIFNGDLSFYAHTAMTETLSFFLLLTFVLVAERMTVPGVADDRGRMLRLALAFGVLAAGAQCVRTSNGLTAAALLLGTLPFIAGWRPRLITVAGVLVAASSVMGVYVFASQQSYNKLTGLGGIQGWMLYGRTSSFADCKKAPAPEGLEDLCDRVPRSERFGPFAYAYARTDFDPKDWSPAIKRFGGIPNGNAELQRYSLNAIWHQPIDYVAAVMHDMGRYVAPNAGSTPWYTPPGPEFQEITKLPPTREGTKTMEYYGVSRYTPGPLAAMAEWWQEVSRFPPLLMVAFLLMPPLALFAIRRREFAATLLPVWFVGVVSAALPVALVSYEYRYGLSTQMLFAVVGPLMIAVIMREVAVRRAARGTGVA